MPLTPVKRGSITKGYKNVQQKKKCIIGNYNKCNQQKTTCTFLYTIQKKYETFFLEKPDTSPKRGQFALRLYIQKAGKIALCYFS